MSKVVDAARLCAVGVGVWARAGEARDVRRVGEVFFCKIVRSLYACPNTIRTRHRGPHTASSRPEQIGVSARVRPWQHADTATLSCGFYFSSHARHSTRRPVMSRLPPSSRCSFQLVRACMVLIGFRVVLRSRCEVVEQVEKKCCSCCCWVLFSKRSGQTKHRESEMGWDGGDGHR